MEWKNLLSRWDVLVIYEHKTIIGEMALNKTSVEISETFIKPLAKSCYKWWWIYVAKYQWFGAKKKAQRQRYEGQQQNQGHQRQQEEEETSTSIAKEMRQFMAEIRDAFWTTRPEEEKPKWNLCL